MGGIVQVESVDCGVPMVDEAAAGEWRCEGCATRAGAEFKALRAGQEAAHGARH